MNIITSYFLVKRLPGSFFIGESSMKYQTQRQIEYLECLRHNAAHSEVNSIHLLVEGKEAYHHLQHFVLKDNSFFPCEAWRRKIIPILKKKEIQITYADLFHYANILLKGKLVMICNSDVYLSQTRASVKELEKLFYQSNKDIIINNNNNNNNNKEKKKPAIALTRYESENINDAPLIKEYRGSHDAFIIIPPIETKLINNINHPQNAYKAENIILYELKQHGYTIVNPCLSFMLIHKHKVELRQWLPPVDEERYALAPPCTIREAIEILK